MKWYRLSSDLAVTLLCQPSNSPIPKSYLLKVLLTGFHLGGAGRALAPPSHSFAPP